MHILYINKCGLVLHSDGTNIFFFKYILNLRTSLDFCSLFILNIYCYADNSVDIALHTATIYLHIQNVKQYHYSPGQTLRIPRG